MKRVSQERKSSIAPLIPFFFFLLSPLRNSPRRLPALPLPLRARRRRGLVEQPALGVADARRPERRLGRIMAAAGAGGAGRGERRPAEEGHFCFGDGRGCFFLLHLRACAESWRAAGAAKARKGRERKREAKRRKMKIEMRKRTRKIRELRARRKRNSATRPSLALHKRLTKEKSFKVQSQAKQQLSSHFFSLPTFSCLQWLRSRRAPCAPRASRGGQVRNSMERETES
jgi:hypothetical protein